MSLRIQNRILVSGQQRVFLDGPAGEEILFPVGWYWPEELEAAWTVLIGLAGAGYQNIRLEIGHSVRFYRLAAGADFSVTVSVAAVGGAVGGDLVDYLGIGFSATAHEHTSSSGSAAMQFVSGLSPWRWGRHYPSAGAMDYTGNSGRRTADRMDSLDAQIWLTPQDDHIKGAGVWRRAIRAPFRLDHGDPAWFTWAGGDFSRRLLAAFRDPEVAYDDMVSSPWPGFKALQLRLHVWTE